MKYNGISDIPNYRLLPLEQKCEAAKKCSHDCNCKDASHEFEFSCGRRRLFLFIKYLVNDPEGVYYEKTW